MTWLLCSHMPDEYLDRVGARVVTIDELALVNLTTYGLHAIRITRTGERKVGSRARSRPLLPTCRRDSHVDSHGGASRSHGVEQVDADSARSGLREASDEPVDVARRDF